MLYDELKKITRDQLQAAIQDLNAESGSPESAVKATLNRCNDFQILDEVVKVFQSIGRDPKHTPEALARVEGMKIVLEALISLAESQHNA